MNANIAVLPMIQSNDTVEPFPGGTVIAPLADGKWLVEIFGANQACRRAFSCLIEPQPGDRVAIWNSGGESFVLAVLKRTETGCAAHLRIDGDLLLEATHDLQLRAGSELSGEAAHALRLNTGELHVDAHTARLTGEDIEMNASETRLHTNLARTVANVLESVARCITQISRTTYRSVEAVDHLRAANVDHAASTSMRLHGSVVLLTAEHLTKVDAAQIHLG